LLHGKEVILLLSLWKAQFFVLNSQKEGIRMKTRIIESLVLMVVALVFALSFVSQSVAEDVKLKGTYAVTGHDVCVAQGTPPAAQNVIKTHTIQGIVTYNHDGSGSSDITLVTLVNPVLVSQPFFPYWKFTPTSTTTQHTSTTFTYTIDPANSATSQTITGTLGYFTTGGIGGINIAGKYITSTPYTLTGYVSADRETIVLSSPADLEDYSIDITIYNDASLQTIFSTSHDICNRSRVLTRVKYNEE